MWNEVIIIFKDETTTIERYVQRVTWEDGVICLFGKKDILLRIVSKSEIKEIAFMQNDKPKTDEN